MSCPAGEPREPDVGSRGVWLIFSLVFYGIPLLLGYAGCRQVWQERASFLEAVAERQLEEVLATCETRADTNEFMTRLLRRAETWVFAGNNPQRRLQGLARSFKRRFPGIFEFTFLDGEGKPLPAFCDFPVPRLILQRYFQAYFALLNGNAAPFERESALAQSFLGAFVPVGKPVHGALIYASASSRRRFVYLSRPRTQGMLIVHLTQTADWRDLGIREEIRLFRSRSARRGKNPWAAIEGEPKRPFQSAPRDQPAPVALTLVDLNSPPEMGLRDLGLASAQAIDLWRKLDRSPLARIRAGKSLYGRRMLKPSLYAVGRRPRISDRQSAKERTWFFTMAIALWAILAWMTRTTMAGNLSPALSVRTKLILAFLYTAGIPLLVMGITSRSYLAERRKTLEHDLHTRAEKTLIAFDNGFPETVKGLEFRLNRAMFHLRIPEKASATLELKRIGRVAHWDNALLFDALGRVICEDALHRLSSTGGIIGRFNESAGNFLRNFDPDHREPRGQGRENFLQKLWAKASTELGSIGSFELSGIWFMHIFYPVADLQGDPRYILLILWGRNRLEWLHAQRSLTDYRRQLEDSDLIAVNREIPEWSVPRETRHAGLIATFVPRIRSNRQSMRDRIPCGEEVTLLTGIRGSHLTGFSLVAVTSDRLLRLDLDRILWRFSTTGLIMAGLSVLVGLFLSRMFLGPVRELTRGVTALAERRFDLRVPVLAQDELGDLSQAFNSMMEGLADLEVARVVQETLFPHAPVSAGFWRVWGTCTAAAQVGGDYYDFFPVEGRKIGIILGDVSGHGVSAALVMAMAKAVIAHPRTGREPAAVMAALQQVFLRVLNRRKMMTCLYGVVDPEEMTFRFCNAGQCYPLLARDGKAGPLELDGLPLGTRTSRIYQPLVVPLRKGDCLVLYTDGLVEARRSDQQAIGNEEVAKVIGDLVRPTPEETERAVRKWHRALARNGPLEDDITVLVLQTVVGGEG